MTIQIIIQVSADVARKLHQQRHSMHEPPELIELAEQHDIVITPMHPGVDSPDLASYFFAEVENPDTAEQAIAQLRKSEIIEAAYIKPIDESP